MRVETPLHFSTWEDYWKIFDELCTSLDQRNQNDVVSSFKEAQLHVNGMTDGWHEFLNAFSESFMINQGKLNENERLQAVYLIGGLEKILITKR